MSGNLIGKKYPKQRFGTEIRGYLAHFGPTRAQKPEWDQVERNPFFFPCQEKIPALEEYIKLLRKAGDSVGGRVNVLACDALIETHGRHDPCVGIRAVPIAEAMLVLIDRALRDRAQNMDVLRRSGPGGR